jgi:hypothetical protein
VTTILVWVAIIYTGDYRGSYAVVDNIATKADCQRIVDRTVTLKQAHWASGQCTQYRKVVTK